MKRIVAVIALVVVLMGNISSVQGGIPSIMPLKHPVTGQTFCTAFSINDLERLWATAGHCAAVAVENKFVAMIDGMPAVPIYVWLDDQHDFAVLQAVASAPALKLAKKAPVVGDEAVIQGFPYGLPNLITARGHVAQRNVLIDANAPISDVLDITVAGGNSGSPVMNAKGEVIGLLWGRMVKSEHALAIPYENLRQFLSAFWQK